MGLIKFSSGFFVGKTMANVSPHVPFHKDLKVLYFLLRPYMVLFFYLVGRAYSTPTIESKRRKIEWIIKETFKICLG
jgi:hypothetical protein